MPVEMVTADTGANPDTAVAAARRLIEERGVHAVVGPMFSQAAIAVGTQVAPYHGVPFISPLAGSPEISEIDDDGYFFRTYISDAAQVDVLAQLADEEGIDEAAVVYRDTAWGRAFHRHFIDHYHGEAASVAVQPTRDSYAEELREAAAGGARALVLLASQADLMQLVRDSVGLDLFDRFLFHRAGRWQELYDAFPDALEGQLGVFYAGRHVTEAEGHWEADFFEAFGHHPISHVTREAYDAALAIMLAAERAGTAEGTALRNALPAIAGPPASGTRPAGRAPRPRWRPCGPGARSTWTARRPRWIGTRTATSCGGTSRSGASPAAKSKMSAMSRSTWRRSSASGTAARGRGRSGA